MYTSAIVLAVVATVAQAQFGGQQQGFQQGPPQQFNPQFAPQQQGQPQQPQFDPNQQQQPGAPQINWGQCPQLEPSSSEKMKKAAVITKCLEVTPIPQNITRESVERHREQVAACALQMEGWFTPEINYKYEKAETEIKSKRLPSAVEGKVLQHHGQCKGEAEEKFPSSTKNVIQQIQLYQACMDFHISEACGIEVVMPQPQGQPQQFAPQQFQPQPGQQQFAPQQFQPQQQGFNRGF
ncbi:hypothetical protein HDE_05370 [Halotydeus destructor]|nr:hypothetical protein HDE_05370 [Halotydeus destructor]